MHFSTSTIVILAAACASAAPMPGRKYGMGSNTNVNSTPASSSAQTPFVFPLANNFPTPSAQEIVIIEEQAGGTLTDAAPPGNPGNDSLINLQLIAFNELFEVAFFSDLLNNITNNVPGYLLNPDDFAYINASLFAIRAQEELHALNANDALAHFNVDIIQPCEYIFPVEDFPSAIALAGTFTDVVMGTLQDVQQIFADNNAGGLVRGIGSVIGQEGEQEGFFRLLQNKRPSSAAFLTTSTRDFAFTALQSFVVPGSCPSLGAINLKTFGGLTVVNANLLTAENGTALFQVDSTQGPIDSSSSVVYISGQNLPVTVGITNYVENGNVVTFEADFPFQGGEDGTGAFNDGLTIAAVVSGNPQFATADAVAEAAVFGPGLIEID